MTVRSNRSNFKRTFFGISAAALLASAAGLGLSSGTAQAEPGFIPAYHWCPGQFFDPGWGPNWDQNVCHDDTHRDSDGDFHGNDFHRDDFHDDHRDGPPQFAAPGNYYTPPGYVGPPPPPGGWQAPPFCVPFVTCPPT